MSQPSSPPPRFTTLNGIYVAECMFLPIFAIFIITAFIIIPYFQQMKVFIVAAAARPGQSVPLLLLLLLLLLLYQYGMERERASEECRKGRRSSLVHVRLAMPRESRAVAPEPSDLNIVISARALFQPQECLPLPTIGFHVSCRYY